MTYKKSLINKVKICSVFLLCILCIASSSDTALAKWKDINTSTGYTVSRLKIPYEFKQKKYGLADLCTNLYAKYNKMFVLQSSACYFEDGEDGNIYKTYKTTWDSKGKTKTKRGMQLPDSSHMAGRFEMDDKGNSYIVGLDTKKEDATTIYICDSSGKLVKTWNVGNMIKYFTKNKEKEKWYGVIDYEIKKNRISLLINETDAKTGEEISSVQVFNIKTGKRIKVYRLSYQFIRIDNGYLYGETDVNYIEQYGYKYPVEKGFFKCSIDGKKCLWSYDCDASKKSDYSYEFDVDNNKIIYLNNRGLYALDTTTQNAPVLLVDNKECKVLKDHYSDISEIYAFDTDAIYIPYHDRYDDAIGTEIYVLKIKK